MLTREMFLTEVRYDRETGLFWWQYAKQGRQMDRPAGSLNSDGYVLIRLFGKSFLAHRLAWFLEKGAWPEGQIDHWNGARSDNRFENLRDVDQSTNQHNGVSHIDKTSDLPRGIDARDGKYRVRVQIRGKRRESRGLTLEAALQLRDEWMKEL